MSDLSHLVDFLEPVDPYSLSGDSGYKEGQAGRQIDQYGEMLPDISEADIVIVGCGEERGSMGWHHGHLAPDAIRHQFYSLYFWHKDIRIADLGNIRQGASLADSYAAMHTVTAELLALGKTVVILGGSHDLSLAQYEAYRSRKTIIEATCVDALIDLTIESPLRSDNFLMEMLTGEPNYIRHYNHLAFQSYLVHPHMLETMDKLRFDCYRLGHIRERLEEIEPVFRNSHMVSVDVSALSYAAAPANHVSPNGLTGEEMCTLTRFAGMSQQVSSFGVYGYKPEHDVHDLTAKQIAQMLWYFVDGRYKGMQEASLKERDSFNEYHISFSEVETVFLQSKRTGRWWMQLPNQRFIACSYNDYVTASSNETPERWLRALERESI
jgi:arginase family enzyme